MTFFSWFISAHCGPEDVFKQRVSSLEYLRIGYGLFALFISGLQCGNSTRLSASSTTVRLAVTQVQDGTTKTQMLATSKKKNQTTIPRCLRPCIQYHEGPLSERVYQQTWMRSPASKHVDATLSCLSVICAQTIEEAERRGHCILAQRSEFCMIRDQENEPIHALRSDSLNDVRADGESLTA